MIILRVYLFLSVLMASTQYYLSDVLTHAASINTSVNRSTAGNLLYVLYVNCDLLSNLLSTWHRRFGTPYIAILERHN